MNFYMLICIALFMSCDNSHDPKISVMTYNIRLNTASDGENAWPKRKDFLFSQIKFYSPDFLGIQEALPDQFQDLKTDLKDYKSIGHGRDGGDSGEYSAIFYNSKKYNVEQSKTFWLSETPDELSVGWDAALQRICTYGLFSNIETSKKIWVFNTHLDHIGVEARRMSMKLIVERIKELNTAQYPVILMGDLNVEPDSQLIQSLSKEMVNTESIAPIRFGPIGTFSGFNFNEPVTKHIDYIFISKSENIKVNKYAILSATIDLKYPSDHFPVYVEMEIK